MELPRYFPSEDRCFFLQGLVGIVARDDDPGDSNSILIIRYDSFSSVDSIVQVSLVVCVVDSRSLEIKKKRLNTDVQCTGLVLTVYCVSETGIFAVNWLVVSDWWCCVDRCPFSYFAFVFLYFEWLSIKCGIVRWYSC